MLAVAGALTLTATPAQAAPSKPEPGHVATAGEREQLVSKLKSMNAPDVVIGAAASATIGFDGQGPYIDGWAPFCRIHFLNPREWTRFIPGLTTPLDPGGTGCWVF
jgi:hypothetical protein